MTKLISVDALWKAREKIEDLERVREFRTVLAEHKDVSLNLGELEFEFTRHDDPAVFAAWDASLAREIDKLVAEIRALGVEPSKDEA